MRLKQLTTHIRTVISRFVRMPKPVVGVNGTVGGGGVGLALAGDLPLASVDAAFTMATPRVG